MSAAIDSGDQELSFDIQHVTQFTFFFNPTDPYHVCIGYFGDSILILREVDPRV